MFSRKRKKENDIIGPSTGWMKWINRFFRFILYPFIHPKTFIILLVLILVAIFAWPMSQGVKPEALKSWYGEKYTQYYEMAKSYIVGSYLEKILPNKNTSNYETVTDNRQIFKVTKNNLSDYQVPNKLNRKAFQTTDDKQNNEEVVVENKQNTSLSDEPYFKKNSTLDLSYLEKPRKISGVLEIVNANEIKLGARKFFLYGIYVQPSSDKGLNAEIFLRKNYAGKSVDCYVGAYAKSGEGTAICIIDGVNINRKLVDVGLSQNVSLF